MSTNRQLELLPNGVTIRHRGPPPKNDGEMLDTDCLIFENPRGVRSSGEWFFVLKDGLDYSDFFEKIDSSGSFNLTLTQPMKNKIRTHSMSKRTIDVLKIPLNNIVTTYLTNSDIDFQFNLSSNLTSIDFDVSSWDIQNMTSLESLFYGCSKFNGSLEHWDLSNVTNIQYLFYECTRFNQPLGRWNVRNVRLMESVFHSCASFNQPLDLWDVSSVVSIKHMFDGCARFNQPIGNWNVSRVRMMESMFRNCTSFNQPLDPWDVSSVLLMNNVFDGCTSFNQPLNSWDVRNVRSINAMFRNCTRFNQPLDRWNLESITMNDFNTVFQGVPRYNPDHNNWNRFLPHVRAEQGTVTIDPVPIEVHTAFEKIKIPPLIDYMVSKNPPMIPMKYTSNSEFVDAIHSVLTKAIHTYGESEDRKADLLRKLKIVLDKIRLLSYTYEVGGTHLVRWQLIQLILSFVVSHTENPKFIRDYFVSFIYDSYNAYATTTDNPEVSVSCPKGILERIILSLHTASIMSCPEDFNRCPEPYNRLIQLLCSAIDVQIDWSELRKEWYKRIDIRAVPVSMRRQHYIDYMMRRAGDICLDEAVERKIRDDVDTLERGDMLSDESIEMLQEGLEMYK